MVIEKLNSRFGNAILESKAAHNEEMVVIERERAIEVFRALRQDTEFTFDFLADVTAVDWLKRIPRFDVVYHLKSLPHRHRLRVKIGVPAEDAWAYSLTAIWKSADWLERECYDMFGIQFRNHPDLRRILLYDSFKGYPLRKDYPYTKRQPLVDEVDPIIHPRRPSA